MQLIDRKTELYLSLMSKDSEEEDELERGRQRIEQSQNFLRGTSEPLSASKRMFRWLKS